MEETSTVKQMKVSYLHSFHGKQNIVQPNGFTKTEATRKEKQK